MQVTMIKIKITPKKNTKINTHKQIIVKNKSECYIQIIK